MSVLEMQKISLASLPEHKQEILELLEKSEVMQITYGAATTDPRPLADIEHELTELKSAIRSLIALENKQQSFIEGFLSGKEEIKPQETIQTKDLSLVIEQLKDLENRVSNLKNLKTQLMLEKEKLLPWTQLEVPLNALCPTKNLAFICVSVKLKQLKELGSALNDSFRDSSIEIINKTKNLCYLAIICLTEDLKRIEHAANKFGTTIISLPQSTNTVKQELIRIQQLIKQTQTDINGCYRSAKKHLTHLRDLKISHDHYLGQKNLLLAGQLAINSDHTFMLQGWIKKKDLKTLKQKINPITKAFEIFEIEPDKDELAPIVIENPKAFSPFEMITKVYGTPKTHDLDPTLFLSFFFILFFGICLGDVGYGITLSLASVYFLKRYKLPKGGIHLFKLLFLGGIASMIAGVLTGSYLGYTPSQIPFPWLSSLQIIDPIKDPLTMLGFSLALGLIQIFFGMLLQLANKIRNKDYLSAVIDDGFWIFFLINLVAMLLSFMLFPQLTFIFKFNSILGAVLLVMTQGRHKHTYIEKFFSGVLSLYKVTGYMGDTLSYSRLLALGMSSAIIGAVINILAQMAGSGIPGFGFIVMLILLVIGHVFNLIISVLGAFVHSMRLQMVEFFSKFYEGGGKEFKPFKRSAEFTTIIN